MNGANVARNAALGIGGFQVLANGVLLVRGLRLLLMTGALIVRRRAAA